MMRQILVGALLAVALIACGGDSDDATTSPMTLPTAVTVAVATSPAVVADTPAPATAAQEDPTATVPPVPESSSATDDVIAAFVAAGLEAESPRPLTREDYGAAPYVGQGVRFLIPSLGADAGGRVIQVSDAAERAALVAYYVDLGKQSAMFFSHVFETGDLVVQINGSLADDIAAQYEAVLHTVAGS